MNQRPEQLARDRIDSQLVACGWTIQNKSSINLHAAIGIAVPVANNEKLPIEFFNFIVIDKCHRRIFYLWKQVLDYFDVFLIGLPQLTIIANLAILERTLYHIIGIKKSREDGVLVPYNVFEIETKITKQGAKISLGEYIDRREKLTRKKFWNQFNEDVQLCKNKM